MKKCILFLVAVFVYSFAIADGGEKYPEVKTNKKALKEFQDMKFGMFVHWGPVSLRGTEIGWSRGKQVPEAEYDQLYKEFNPVLFNADDWVKSAKDAGMNYLVITTKHHDGFCLWDSKYTDYDMAATPFKKRDVLRELADACKKQGISFGAYYSVCDWRHPDFPLGSPGGKTKKANPNLDGYVQYLRNQVTELIQNYGPLSTIWFDVPQAVDATHGIPIVDMIYGLQPDILINNRAYCESGRTGGFGNQNTVGDYNTPEQKIGSFDLVRPWETCMTICKQWAWKPNDKMKSYAQCIQTLLKTVGGGGNLLFNVGPMPDGRIEQRQIDRLKEMGNWLTKYGESVYETTGGPYKPTEWISSTRKGNKIYLHLYKLNGSQLLLPSPGGIEIKGCSIINGAQLSFTQTDETLIIQIPKGNLKETVTTIELELTENTSTIKPIELN